MSVETDFRGLLAGRPALASLLGSGGVALDAVAEGDEPPYVIFSVRHSPQLGLDNTVLTDQCSITVQSWAGTAAEAAAIADQVALAVAAAPTARGACVVERTSTIDAELGLDGVQQVVEWWG